jgi:hypothetical protein
MKSVVAASSLIVLALAATSVHAGDAPAVAAEQGFRHSTWVDLRVWYADTGEGDDEAHYGLFPSIILGQRLYVGRGFSAEAAVSAVSRTARWENIGGMGTAYFGARKDYAHGWLAAGTTVPLDPSLPRANMCYPGQPSGNSLTYAYGPDTGCWDRSAYRRAALHRGYWNAWMWAPDWVTPSLRAASRLMTRGNWSLASEVGAGVGLPVTDVHEGDLAFVAQAMLEARHETESRVLGLRVQGAGVFLEETSPFLISLEAYGRLLLGRVALEVRVTLPVEDLSNDYVDPGLGPYRIIEYWSLGLGGAVAY